MKTDANIHRIAFATVARNFGLGMILVLMVLPFFPGIELRHTLGLWFFSLILMCVSHFPGCAGIGGEFRLEMGLWMRLVACLLLACSFIAIFWKEWGLPHATGIILASFGLRWLLFLVEGWNIRIADLRRLPIPSQATRLRRSITFVTGGIIPLMILAGLPTVPLLAFSFGLTAFAQWVSTFEQILYRRLSG